MAPKPPPKKITTWSFSRWNTYQQCPYKAKLLYIDKMKEPDSPAQARGIAIHKAAEDFVLGKLKTLPKELQSFKAEFQKLKKLGAKVELSWAFTSNWSPTSWFANDAWCRVKLDAVTIKDGVAVLIDYKTGRQYPEHVDQLGLYALGGFCVAPQGPNLIETQDWYLDEHKLEKGQERILGEDFERSQVEALKDEWADNTRHMLTDTKFLPKPSNKCQSCHFRHSNGGPCRF